tara:strand:- start:11231 stop:11359 length:129 start_codon:yes stop_codon:yes gene_type:complete
MPDAAVFSMRRIGIRPEEFDPTECVEFAGQLKNHGFLRLELK